VGSKSFTESYALAEIISQVIEGVGEASVTRKFGLGQTGIAYEAVKNGKVDLYPEYSGTLAEVILKNPKLDDVRKIREALKNEGLTLTDSLGFNNTYALAVKKKTADTHRLKTISDLVAYPDIKIGFSHEFLNREDGYPKLKARYASRFRNVHGLSHSLAYEALERDEIEVMDIYSTDAKVVKYDLTVLGDDRGVFPKYFAVILARADLAQRFPNTWHALTQLEGKLSEEVMVRLNAMAELEAKGFADIARIFLKNSSDTRDPFWRKLIELTEQHLFLVGISLAVSVVVGVFLAILANQYLPLAQVILGVSGLIQTIPSLALLCFLIPLFGIGTRPALVALFLYGLLPIVQNAYVGLTSIDSKLLEVAKALGLSGYQKLVHVELPLAMPSIMAGIKTSAIINVGTATLAALIGAGGYGVPIVTGLALNDIPTILQGAIPAAVMALAIHGFFEGLNRLVIPKGLRI